MSSDVLYLRDPATGAELRFDAVISYTGTRAYRVSQHPVERGVDVSDHVQQLPVILSVQATVTESPWAGSRPDGLAGVALINRTLALLSSMAGKRLQVVTHRLGVFPSMALSRVPLPVDKFRSLTINLELQEVRIATATIVDVGVTSSTKVTLAANKDLACAAGTTAVDLSAGTGTFKPPTGTFTFQGKQAATATANTITDPGNAGAIPVTANGVCAMTSAGAETRTLAIPTFMGQQLSLICDTYVGNIVVTSAQAINQAGNTIMTFGVVNDCITLLAMTIGGALRWRVIANDGVALS